MIDEPGVWSIFFLPIASFLVISLVVRPFFSRYSYQSGLITVVAIAGSLVLSVWTLKTVISEGEQIFAPHEWVSIGALDISLGLTVDALTSIMLVVVTGVSLMVQVYSLAYMKNDPGFSRYFAIMSLFTASMIGLVIASNVVQLYVFWELVGLCSYLLIGFWYARPSAVAAAKKAFLVTRIGDLGFLIAILYLFFNASTFNGAGLNPLVIEDINTGIAAGLLGHMAVTWLALGIFAGAIGKSAQFPLHVWLPDAMEGPTPVSALIHAATMVAAGVFLVARFYPVFEASDDAMRTVALIGAFTAVFAATMALVTNDIKRVLAYSTISQLGYMVAALGVGAFGAALFHLFNHAFFKALLFMGAGSVNHASGTFDMRYMGGLRRYMPWTYVAMVIGSLSLAGIFPLSGFWSKDEILLHAWRGDSGVDSVVFWLLMIGVLLTAIYAFRMVHMTFHGGFRGGVDKELEENAAVTPAGAEHGVHLAESPWLMVGPMVVLGVASVASGYLVNPLGFSGGFIGIDPHWFTEFVKSGHVSLEKFSLPLAVSSVVVAIVGIGIATLISLRSKPSTQILSDRALEKAGRPLVGVHRVITQKYYMDQLYEKRIVSQGVYRTLAGTMDWIDRKFVDSTAELVGLFSSNVGRAISLFQSGQLQAYGVGIALGVVVILGAFLIFQ